MKLYLNGHNYKYAAEQIMMAVLPGARPEYSEDKPKAGEDFARVSLHLGERFASASAELSYNGRRANGSARVGRVKLSGKLETDRELQKIIKLAFYRAAVKVLEEPPVWGALTGIRPGTLLTRMLERGMSEKAAVREMRRQYFVQEDRARLCLDTARASLKVKGELLKKDAALYVGIPFCPTRCAYCSFVSQSVEKSMALIEPFLAALRREMEATAKIVKGLGLRIIAVYIGGGTPTTLSARQLSHVLDWLYSLFDLSSVREFSVEAGRPDTITEDKLRAMSGRVTRISINPQSMSDEVLSAIGRRHKADDIRSAYGMARRILDADINMDLIAGLPADTPEGFLRTSREIISMEPENITVHTLALKRGTQISLEDTKRPGKEDVRAMLDSSAELLTCAGYSPYYLYRQKFMSGGFENVGWAVSGKESLYNILIMEELCSILAMGGGGSTKLVDTETGRVQRIFDLKYPKEYIDGIGRMVSDKRRIVEFYDGQTPSPKGEYNDILS
ncbi:MAG: coproporphyrinogen dehydrogenase HemZ [Oscillospiraceae bacterium]